MGCHCYHCCHLWELLSGLEWISFTTFSGSANLCSLIAGLWDCYRCSKWLVVSPSDVKNLDTHVDNFKTQCVINYKEIMVICLCLKTPAYERLLNQKCADNSNNFVTMTFNEENK